MLPHRDASHRETPTLLMKKIICIEGATGSGKSDLALELARLLDTEIISADSRQVYKYLNIGTAKPNPDVLSEIKHHLIDIITPDAKYNAGTFVKDAEKLIDNINKSNKIPIVCGGSMLYIKSLLEGISKIPDVDDESKAKTVEFMNTQSLEECYRFVKKIDPKFADNISPTDKQRISRVIEIWFAFGKGLTDFWIEDDTTIEILPYKIYINKERSILYNDINKRMRNMIDKGLINEIESVLAMGYKPTDPGFNSVGYKEFVEVLRRGVAKNELHPMKPLTKSPDEVPYAEGIPDGVPYVSPAKPLSLNECIELASQHTRNYAKRQITWYRKCSFDCEVSNSNINIKKIFENIMKHFEI